MKTFKNVLESFGERWTTKESKDGFDKEVRKVCIEGVDFLSCVTDNLSQAMADDGRFFVATARLYANMRDALIDKGFTREEAVSIVSRMDLMK